MLICYPLLNNYIAVPDFLLNIFMGEVDGVEWSTFISLVNVSWKVLGVRLLREQDVVLQQGSKSLISQHNITLIQDEENKIIKQHLEKEKLEVRQPYDISLWHFPLYKVIIERGSKCAKPPTAVLATHLIHSQSHHRLMKSRSQFL